VVTSRTQAIQIDGLKQLQADLRALDAKLPRELRKVNLSVAQLVADKARGRAAGLGPQSAKAASAIKAAAEQRGASVKMTATSAVPWAMGAEFGAGHDVERKRKSGTYKGYNALPEWRGAGPGSGYIVFPTVRASGDDIVNAYDVKITELLNQVFHD
jgi:hypothetical protein